MLKSKDFIITVASNDHKEVILSSIDKNNDQLIGEISTKITNKKYHGLEVAMIQDIYYGQFSGGNIGKFLIHYKYYDNTGNTYYFDEYYNLQYNDMVLVYAMGDLLTFEIVDSINVGCQCSEHCMNSISDDEFIIQCIDNQRIARNIASYLYKIIVNRSYDSINVSVHKSMIPIFISSKIDSFGDKIIISNGKISIMDKNTHKILFSTDAHKSYNRQAKISKKINHSTYVLEYGCGRKNILYIDEDDKIHCEDYSGSLMNNQSNLTLEYSVSKSLIDLAKELEYLIFYIPFDLCNIVFKYAI